MFTKNNILKRFACRRQQEYCHAHMLFQSGNPFELDKWVFHDENWVRVQHRREHRSLVAAGKPPDVVDNRQEPTSEIRTTDEGGVRIEVTTASPDEWIYLYLDPVKYPWTNYSWRFTVQRDTNFRELQFGFRYQDFYNRYRYRFEADHIFFDKIIKGKCFHALGATPFRMELGTLYNVRIDAYENRFGCYVNGVLMSRDFDFDRSFPKGSIAVILWEDKGQPDIRAEIGPMTVHRLVAKSEIP